MGNSPCQGQHGWLSQVQWFLNYAQEPALSTCPQSLPHPSRDPVCLLSTLDFPLSFSLNKGFLCHNVMRSGAFPVSQDLHWDPRAENWAFIYAEVAKLRSDWLANHLLLPAHVREFPGEKAFLRKNTALGSTVAKKQQGNCSERSEWLAEEGRSILAHQLHACWAANFIDLPCTILEKSVRDLWELCSVPLIA